MPALCFLAMPYPPDEEFTQLLVRIEIMHSVLLIAIASRRETRHDARIRRKP
jgi:hypothetical protein